MCLILASAIHQVKSCRLSEHHNRARIQHHHTSLGYCHYNEFTQNRSNCLWESCSSTYMEILPPFFVLLLLYFPQVATFGTGFLRKPSPQLSVPSFFCSSLRNPLLCPKHQKTYQSDAITHGEMQVYRTFLGTQGTPCAVHVHRSLCLNCTAPLTLPSVIPGQENTIEGNTRNRTVTALWKLVDNNNWHLLKPSPESVKEVSLITNSGWIIFLFSINCPRCWLLHTITDIF